MERTEHGVVAVGEGDLIDVEEAHGANAKVALKGPPKYAGQRGRRSIKRSSNTTGTRPQHTMSNAGGAASRHCSIRAM